MDSKTLGRQGDDCSSLETQVCCSPAGTEDTAALAAESQRLNLCRFGQRGLSDAGKRSHGCWGTGTLQRCGVVLDLTGITDLLTRQRLSWTGLKYKLNNKEQMARRWRWIWRWRAGVKRSTWIQEEWRNTPSTEQTKNQKKQYLLITNQHKSNCPSM